ncbi:carboxypeptidase regulatory-like domain-containing protein [Isosphaeraceae bacterium EP7]
MHLGLPIAFDSPAWRPLIVALLHTLWQGGLLALLLVLALRRLPASRGNARYTLALAAQFGVVVAWLLTWSILSVEPARKDPRPTQAISIPSRINLGARPAPSVSASLPDTSPAIVELSPEWVGLAAAGWLAGVALMLTRAAAATASAMRLGKGPTADDAALLDAVDRIRQGWGIRRPIRVVVTRSRFGPAVLGLLRPTLLLPLSLMTGLDPDALQAILAHELAHIRRHDFAWNLAQMCVESLLFFNPAVWWLGRQARQEREACCDAMAVTLLGRPLDYSRALAAWAERLREHRSIPNAALAWTGRDGSSSLLGRIVRILRPSEAPRLQLSWAGLALLLVGCPLLLIALKLGSLAFSKIIPTPERIEKIERARAQYTAIPPDEPVTHGTIRGTLRNPDGSPWAGPPIESWAAILNPASNLGGGMPGKPQPANFSMDVLGGRNWLIFFPEGYAPAVTDPIEVGPDEVIENVNVMFQPGFKARIRVIDEMGVPAAGVKIKGSLIVDELNVNFPEGRWGGPDGLTTDAEGFATVEHASDRVYRLSAKAPGYRRASEVRVRLKPGEPTTLTLVKYRTKPARGLVVAPDGTPVAGARLGVFSASTVNQSSFAHGRDTMATTGADGRFELRELEDETSYGMLVTTDLYGRGLLTDVRAGQEDVRFVIGPRRSIRGAIRGSLDALIKRLGKPVVTILQNGTEEQRRLTRYDDGFIVDRILVEPVGDGGQFVVEDVLPGEVVIHAGDHVLRLEVTETETAAVIDLTRPLGKIPTRKLIIRLIGTDSSDPVTGSIVGQFIGRSGLDQPGPGQFDETLVEGEVSVEVPIDCQVNFDARSVKGYWFPSQSLSINSGDKPLSLKVQASPAGAIVGQVFNSDGTPADRYTYLIYKSTDAPGSAGWVRGQYQFQEGAESRYFLGPLPFGKTYVLTAGRNANQVDSPPIRLDGRVATVKVDIKLAATSDVTGRIVAPDGKPLAGINVSVDFEQSKSGSLFSSPTTTDREGRFRFSGLNPGLGPYVVDVVPLRDYQGTRATVVAGGPPVEIKLARGRIIEGRVLDAATGWPIPGAGLSARLQELETGVVWSSKVEGKTDANGHFRFSTLPAKPMILSVEEGHFRERGGDLKIDANSAGPIEFRVALPADSALRPRRPDGR